eukprot:CAMPEP_0198202562 /NCGR_PEP_ID=MMETSP1445-20131203/5742_1 /TAXON_ID=36898 /ORGANISM="Pyramimonas sp., Strain CCMP2087" /LENGTH=466 /DNA_ID=CAMNT_0043873545 /DNA_START=159 /DNA_END=1559 /DNA_ORIENTATION=-
MEDPISDSGDQEREDGFKLFSQAAMLQSRALVELQRLVRAEKTGRKQTNDEQRSELDEMDERLSSQNADVSKLEGRLAVEEERDAKLAEKVEQLTLKLEKEMHERCTGQRHFHAELKSLEESFQNTKHKQGEAIAVLETRVDLVESRLKLLAEYVSPERAKLLFDAGLEELAESLNHPLIAAREFKPITLQLDILKADLTKQAEEKSREEVKLRQSICQIEKLDTAHEKLECAFNDQLLSLEAEYKKVTLDEFTKVANDLQNRLQGEITARTALETTLAESTQDNMRRIKQADESTQMMCAETLLKVQNQVGREIKSVAHKQAEGLALVSRQDLEIARLREKLEWLQSEMATGRQLGLEVQTSLVEMRADLMDKIQLQMSVCPLKQEMNAAIHHLTQRIQEESTARQRLNLAVAHDQAALQLLEKRLQADGRLASGWTGKEPPEKALGWAALEGMHNSNSREKMSE